MMRREVLCGLLVVCVTACPDTVPNRPGEAGADGALDAQAGPMDASAIDAAGDARPSSDAPSDLGAPADRPMAPDVVCASGFADCDRNAANGCETPIESNADHCGACGSACERRLRTTTTCVARTCRYVCDEGFADCTSAAGCETDLRNSSAHCGGCGRACTGAMLCSGGQCLQTCSARCCDGNVVDAGYAPTSGDCWSHANTACESRRGLFSATFAGGMIPDQCGGQFRWDFCGRSRACADCERANCCSEGTACGGNPACVMLTGCILGCIGSPSPGACLNACRVTHASGTAAYDAVMTCHRTHCAGVC